MASTIHTYKKSLSHNSQYHTNTDNLTNAPLPVATVVQTMLMRARNIYNCFQSAQQYTLVETEAFGYGPIRSP